MEQPRQAKNFVYRHDEPNEQTKEEPRSDVLLESLFCSLVRTKVSNTVKEANKPMGRAEFFYLKLYFFQRS
jgi:hypothetical protein